MSIDNADMIARVNSILRPLSTKAEEHDGKVVFVRGSVKATEDITNVAAALAFADAAKLGPPTASFAAGHYEHMLSMVARTPNMFGEQPADLISQDGALRCTVSRPSLPFFLAVLKEDGPAVRRSLLGFMGRRIDPDKVVGFSDAFAYGRTIRVTDSTAKRSRDELRQVAEAALFNYAFGQSAVYVLTRSWDPLSRRLTHRRQEAVQFPRRLYNGELVSYYQLAMSSDSALLSYLSLYNVLEYFFSSVSERVLHSKLADCLVQPDFAHSKPRKLRELAKIVRKHDQKVNELVALRLVIEEKFDVKEVADYITRLEAEVGPLFTDGSAIFGEPVPVSLEPTGLATTLAKRIYHLRCLLVHNKEAATSRYLPFSKDDDIIRRELPLMVFLAEKVIVATGEDFE